MLIGLSAELFVNLVKMLLKFNKGHTPKQLSARLFAKQNKPVSDILDRTINPKKQESQTFQKLRSFFSGTFNLNSKEQKESQSVNDLY